MCAIFQSKVKMQIVKENRTLAPIGFHILDEGQLWSYLEESERAALELERVDG